ncbi:hypothetical protein bcgnr5371_19320 [Bacillus cereus]
MFEERDSRGAPEIVSVSSSNQFKIDKGEDRDESIYFSKCKLGKKPVNGFECSTAISSKSSNFR